ncbi:MAG TPA: AAA family ATPase [Gemmataceae bacterium]|nr:AAA family ATPase [Gemmataceae bacterium]
MSIPRRRRAASAATSTDHPNGQNQDHELQSNGEPKRKPPKPKKKDRKAEATEPATAKIPPTVSVNGTTQEKKSWGKLASEYQPLERRYLLEPLFPEKRLTVFTGKPGSGKSHLGAFCLALGERPMFFPGFEEEFAGDPLARMAAAGVKMDKLVVLEGVSLSLYDGNAKLLQIFEHYKPDVVLFEKLNSYIGALGRPKDGEVIETALENLCKAGSQKNATIFGIKHPGKQAGNILKGASEWMEVPRVVYEVEEDKRRKGKRRIIPHKYPWSPWPAPQEFVIEGPANGPGKVRLLGVANTAVRDAVRETPEEEKEGKLLNARKYFRRVLGDEPVNYPVVANGVRLEDFSISTLKRAASLDGVKITEPDTPGPGSHSTWQKPDSWLPLEA